MNMVSDMLRDWTKANARKPVRGGRRSPEPTLSEKGWLKSRVGVLKIIIDAGWSGENGQGLGLVIRDHYGECMYAGAATNFLSSRSDPAVAEALAACWALDAAVKLELDTIVLETDSKELYSCYWNKKHNSLLEPIVQDCRLLASKFVSFDLIHCSRNCNKVAHLLASMASEYPNKCWWEMFPSAISSALLADVFSLIL